MSSRSILDKSSGCGVIYAVTGRHFFEEARTSIRSLRSQHPELPVLIIIAGEEDIAKEVLEDIGHVEFLDLKDRVIDEGYDIDNKMEASRCLKTNVMLHSPFAYSLFLDTDTYIRKPIHEIFSHVGHENPESRADLVVTCEPITGLSAKIESDGRPRATVLRDLSNTDYFNSGVYAFNASTSSGFARTWRDVFRKQSLNGENAVISEWKRLCDQTAFNTTLKKFPDISKKILSNLVWNAQCKILNELIRKDKFEDIRILHCKMAHFYGGATPDLLMQSEYIRSFSLQD